MTLTVNEIYQSIQGESTFAGLPCVFVRLAFCDLRCAWCDTTYAFHEGEKMSLDDILAAVAKFNCPLVELTGGEPLLQPAAPALLVKLLERGHRVLLETAGHRDISAVDPRVTRIMDLKCPDSGMSDRNRWENIPYLTANDEVKCVIASRADYEWAREQVRHYALPDKVRAVLFAPVFGSIEPRQLVEWLLADALPVRFQLQLHKFIWEPRRRGV
ncbi:MAG: 7-carboxy-7-deazaguanine synthase QueE [Verrucomicrobiales bacterium]|jgi:7-carboxy-7-deazaguanine synthase|nr:7-carboxy-7-deazaguanine synthase QueE [Verrucomicrobiales bacterium]